MGFFGRELAALKTLLRNLGKWSELLQRAKALSPSQPVIEDGYIGSMPCAQNAVDLITGWNHAMPPEAGVIAGTAPLYSDARIEWCADQFGALSGRRILELGPLEASHTYMLHHYEPALIDAIEAKKLSFLRCLIAKELLHLHRARFQLGDFQKWLEFSGQRYDLIVASGVLYHMSDPVRLLELASSCTDAIFLWTHYFDDVQMPPEDPRRGAFSGSVEVRPFRDIDVRLHRRSYHGAWRDKAFCGGMHDDHAWMEKRQILDVLRALGFDDVRTTHDTSDHPGGPCLSIFARRGEQTG